MSRRNVLKVKKRYPRGEKGRLRIRPTGGRQADVVKHVYTHPRGRRPAPWMFGWNGHSATPLDFGSGELGGDKANYKAPAFIPWWIQRGYDVAAKFPPRFESCDRRFDPTIRPGTLLTELHGC